MHKLYGYEKYKSHYVVIEYSRANPLDKKIIAHCDTVEECKEEMSDLKNGKEVA